MSRQAGPPGATRAGDREEGRRQGLDPDHDGERAAHAAGRQAHEQDAEGGDAQRWQLAALIEEGS